MKSHKEKLERNLKLFYPYLLSQRRLFVALIGIFFLTMPSGSEKIHMLGIFISAGALLSFLIEIPSGYFSDTFGHKKTLILSKILMMTSTVIYILADSWHYFLLASIIQAISFSFQSGTISALNHNTLEELDREKEYTKDTSKRAANISIISAALLVTAPVLATQNILYPFYLALALDLIGLIASIFFEESSLAKTDKNKNTKTQNVREIFKDSYDLGFLSFASLTSISAGVGLAVFPYRELYLSEIGLPLALLGVSMALSRVIWFAIGHSAHKIEELFTLKQIFVFEIISIPLLFISIIIFPNPYFVLFIFALMVGYKHGVRGIKNRFFLNNFIGNKKYKATAISIKSQVKSLFEIILPAVLGFFMASSYQHGFLFAAVLTFVGSIIAYHFAKKKL